MGIGLLLKFKNLYAGITSFTFQVLVFEQLALIESTTGAARPTFILDCFVRGNHSGYQWNNTEKKLKTEAEK